MTNMTEFHTLRHMNKIKKFSAEKHYDVVFFDKNQECCGVIENITGISKKNDINDYACDVCTKIPITALVTNTDGTESGRWTLALDWFNREF